MKNIKLSSDTLLSRKKDHTMVVFIKKNAPPMMIDGIAGEIIHFIHNSKMTNKDQILKEFYPKVASEFHAQLEKDLDNLLEDLLKREVIVEVSSWEEV